MTALAPEKPAVALPDAVRAHVTAARPSRNRYFDVLRAGCIAYVVLYHMFPLAALSYWPRMGLLFAIAGSLTARSLDASRRRAVGRRLRRLLVPMWATAALAVPLMLALGWRPDAGWQLLFWVAPFADPPGADWAGPLTDVLWYLRTYLWLLVLSPVLLPVFRRFPRMTLLVPVTVAVAIGTGLFSVWTLGEYAGAVVRDAAVFVPCWLIGFAHRDEWIAHARRATVLVGGFVLAFAGVAWAFTHPVAGSVDLNAIPLAQLLFSAGIVLVLLRAAPPLAGLERRWWPYLPVNWLVTVVNRRAMVIYLWHNVAIALCFPIGGALGVWGLGEVGGTVACFGVGLVLVVVGVVGFGWVEDLSAGRRPALVPHLPPEPVGLGALAAAGGSGEAARQAVDSDDRAGAGGATGATGAGRGDGLAGAPGSARHVASGVADPWAMRLLRADQIPAEQSRPVRVAHAVGIAGGEVRSAPTQLLVREVAWSAFPGQSAPPRPGRAAESHPTAEIPSIPPPSTAPINPKTTSTERPTGQLPANPREAQPSPSADNSADVGSDGGADGCVGACSDSGSAAEDLRVGGGKRPGAAERERPRPRVRGKKAGPKSGGTAKPRTAEPAAAGQAN